GTTLSNRTARGSSRRSSFHDPRKPRPRFLLFFEHPRLERLCVIAEIEFSGRVLLHAGCYDGQCDDQTCFAILPEMILVHRWWMQRQFVRQDDQQHVWLTFGQFPALFPVTIDHSRSVTCIQLVPLLDQALTAAFDD